MKNGTDFNGTSFLDAGHLKYLYMSPQGRINRQRIWIGGLLLGLAMIPILIVSGILIGIGFFLMASLLTGLSAVIGVVIYILAIIGVSIADIMLYIKRAHDRNRTGWYILLTMIPFIGIIWSIELLFFKGTEGTNQYGGDPRYLLTVQPPGDQP